MDIKNFIRIMTHSEIWRMKVYLYSDTVKNSSSAEENKKISVKLEVSSVHISSFLAWRDQSHP